MATYHFLFLFYYFQISEKKSITYFISKCFCDVFSFFCQKYKFYNENYFFYVESFGTTIFANKFLVKYIEREQERERTKMRDCYTKSMQQVFFIIISKHSGNSHIVFPFLFQKFLFVAHNPFFLFSTFHHKMIY